MHTRIVETLAGQFRDLAERQPELLAHHCTEAGLIEKAALLWGQAGRRSLERSVLVEAAAQLTRALDQLATLPSTPPLLREQINLQVAAMRELHRFLARLAGSGDDSTNFLNGRTQRIINKCA